MLKKLVVSASLLLSVGSYAADEVSLIEAQAFRQSGCFGCTQFDGTIQVENLAFEKSVNVIVNVGEEGLTQTVPASYASTDVNGKERWVFSTMIAAWDGEPSSFKIEYLVNQNTYVDDNGGTDYSVTLNDDIFGETDNVELKELRKFATGASCPGCETVTGSVIVENLAFNKDVVIRHTAHNGFEDEIVASFAATLDNNKELWTFEQVFASSQPKVAHFDVVYQVDGIVYGDSNNEIGYGTKPFWVDAFYGNVDNAIGSVTVEAVRQLGCFGCTQVQGDVKVKNLDHHKTVTVSYLLEDGQLVDIEASFSEGPAADGYETWTFAASSFIAPWDPQPVSAVVTYQVAGQIFSEAFPMGFTEQ